MKSSSSFKSSKGPASLKVLSETEKFQLMQLHRTREKIAKELQKYPNAEISYDDDDDIGFSSYSRPASKNERSSRGGSRSKRVSSGYGNRPTSQNDYFETLKAGLDMVPIMATTGNFAMGGDNESTKGKIKLPIFKLPSIDTGRVKSRDQNRSLEKALKQGDTFEQRFLPYRDMASYRKALVLMIKSFGQRDTEFIRRYFNMSVADIADLETELQKKLEIGKAPRLLSSQQQQRPALISKSSSRSVAGFAHDSNEKSLEPAVSTNSSKAAELHPEGILDTLFREDHSMSVFLLAKDVVLNDKKEREIAAFGDQQDAIQYNKALRSATSKMDMRALGLSDSMTQFLTTGLRGTTANHTSHHASMGSEGFEKLKTNASLALGGFASALAHKSSNNTMETAATVPSAGVRKIGSMPALYSAHPGAAGQSGGFAAAYGRKNTVKSKHNSAKKHNSAVLRLQPLFSQSENLAQRSIFSQQGLLSTSADSLRGGTSRLQKEIAAGSAADLTTALMDSLRTMQKHSSMIKESISSAQSVMSIADPKAKGLVFQVAAEALALAMQPLLTCEIRRGFIAWCFVVRQERRQEKAGGFIHFLTLRNCLLALNTLTLRVLRYKLKRWKDFTAYEIRRIQKEIMLRAVLRLQAAFRKRLARRKVEVLRQRRKYQKLYDSTIKIQALIRGKVQRWHFLRDTRDKLHNASTLKIQCCIRGFQARKRVYLMRLRRNKALAASTIQKIVRGRLATKRVQLMLKNRRFGVAATKIQCYIRGYLARKHMARILIELAHYKYAVRIQALVRGALGRIHLSKKIAAMQEYRDFRNKAATKIQSAYRGYRCSVLYKMMMHKVNKVKKEQNKAATSIGRIVRGFVARAYLRDLKLEQRAQWIADARLFKETWAEDSESWFYYNEETGEALWEPNAMGYTKSDGLLVLANGEIIEDPLKAPRLHDEDGEAEGELEEDEEAEAHRVAHDKKKNARLCSECSSRVAIRSCNECGDKFCTKCYKFLHSTGTRRTHTFTAVGPLDCTECELRLAERWCVSCDEHFCDGCWRKVHSRGKRAFHPYSEVSPEGRIDARIFTMDGDQLSDYDSSYAQQRVDVNSYNSKQEKQQQLLLANQQSQQQEEGYDQDYYASADESTVAIYDSGNAYGSTAVVGGEGSVAWEQYYDDNGYPYWYDPVSGTSQYETPPGYEGY